MREDWIECTFEDLLDYEQPTKYIVKEEDYNDKYPTPVLTAGKGFIKGYTKENFGIFDNLPTIIFDDFTTASQFVNFRFKVKSSAMKILLPKSNLVNLKFVFGAMQVNKVRSETHKRYWISEFSKIYFGLPPLSEQRAIVKKMEQLFSALDASIADLKKAQGQLKIYRQAVLKKAFEGEFTKEWRNAQTDLTSAEKLLQQIDYDRENYSEIQLKKWSTEKDKWLKNQSEKSKPDKPKFLKALENLTTDELAKIPTLNSLWKWVKIDKVVHFSAVSLKAGPFGSSLKKEFYVDNGYKVYGQEQVIAGNIEIGNYYIDLNKYKELYSCSVQPYDILISLVGTVGKVLILPENAPQGIINPRLIKITLNKYYSPKFFKYYFESSFLKSLYKLENHGTTMDVLNLEIVKNLPFPLCTIKEQHQIVKEIESRLSVCDAVEHQIKTSLDKAEALRQSILKKAFAGALLTQAELEVCRKEPDYEPASVLLEKIKAEKQTGKKKAEKEKAITPAKPTAAATGKISADIQAGLIAKVIRLHEDNPKHHTLLTHIKCEKLSHLVEYHLQIPLGRQPVKDAAGPDDYKRLKAVEHRAKMAGYFSVQKNKIGYTYVSGKGVGKAITQFEKNLSEEQKQRVDQLLHLFLTFDLEQAEIVATVYAAWNNLLILGKNNPTDQEIVQEARYNWSDRKLGLEEHRFYKAIEWMQKDTVNLVPTGYGTLVDFPKKKK
ncbi:restriction endonuclease subunit S [Sphingobacterium sp. UBA6645]|uniref:restriction endonuclease subunit S n=1 Tax=Sphingobacterium sp. UBA6645 TaxID=1947511 RepID=UPI0025E9119E|nr:restriction endonuclease subunit S [Sphingobacterium sp. UBA6645]